MMPLRSFTRSLVAMACLPSAALGHHSFPMTFNTSQVVDVEGTVVELDWVSPHVTLVVESIDGVRWQIESNSPRGLERYGIFEDAVAPGVELTVAGFPARNGDAAMYSSHFLLDGVEHVVRPGSEPRFHLPAESR